MPNTIADTMGQDNLEAVLEYLAEQVEYAESKEDLNAVLEIARELFLPSTMYSAVQGLDHIRAEIDHTAYAPATSGERASNGTLECTVKLTVPQILSETFRTLSDRMTALQDEDPETFANATSALSWLAKGELCSNQN